VPRKVRESDTGSRGGQGQTERYTAPRAGSP